MAPATAATVTDQVQVSFSVLALPDGSVA